MALNTKLNLSDAKVYQGDGQVLTLSGDTVIATVGNIKYSVHPTFTGGTQLVDKDYVDGEIISATGQSIYNLTSPATVNVGGINPGYDLTGKTSNCLLKEILTPYQLPAFSSFSNDVTTPVEVGCQITGSKSFSWGFSNTANVEPNTMCLRDVTASSTLASNISASSPQSATITTKTFVTCGETQVWCGSAKNSCLSQFNSGSYVVTALLPYFWGKCTCPGTAGANRPTATAGMITGGTKVLVNSSSSVGINFSSTDNDYLWFAIPASVSDKVCWCVTALNNGAIGGGVSPACNLFPAPDTVNSVANVCWSGQIYNVYISNYQSAASSMSIS